MTTKPLRAGGEIDSWCTKCQLILNHRIIAVDKGSPVRVECLTCRSPHMYRANAPGTKVAATTSKAPGAAKTTTRTTKAAAAAKVEQARVDRERSWEKAIAGRSVGDFTPYRLSGTFTEGELLRHTRFGDGVILRILDAHKVEVLFKEETKTLAQGLTD